MFSLFTPKKDKYARNNIAPMSDRIKPENKLWYSNVDEKYHLSEKAAKKTVAEERKRMIEEWNSAKYGTPSPEFMKMKLSRVEYWYAGTVKQKVKTKEQKRKLYVNGCF